MTADPVSPVIAEHDGHGHQEDGDARDSNADGSELSFDPEELLFDEDDGEISGLPPEEWDQMEREAAAEMEKGDGGDQAMEEAPVAGDGARRQSQGRRLR